jgi:hypothetical protein
LTLFKDEFKENELGYKNIEFFIQKYIDGFESYTTKTNPNPINCFSTHKKISIDEYLQNLKDEITSIEILNSSELDIILRKYILNIKNSQKIIKDENDTGDLHKKVFIGKNLTKLYEIMQGIIQTNIYSSIAYMNNVLTTATIAKKKNQYALRYFILQAILIICEKKNNLNEKNQNITATKSFENLNFENIIDKYILGSIDLSTRHVSFSLLFAIKTICNRLMLKKIRLAGCYDTIFYIYEIENFYHSSDAFKNSAREETLYICAKIISYTKKFLERNFSIVNKK